MAQDALLTPRQAAELVNVTASTVRRWVRDGEVRALRLGTARNSPMRIRTRDLVKQLHLAREGDQQ